MKLIVTKDVTTIEIHILNRMSGNEKDMLYSNETTGVVFTAVLERPKFITRDIRKETSEKNRSNGLFQYVNPVMTNSIIDIICIAVFPT